MKQLSIMKWLVSLSLLLIVSCAPTTDTPSNSEPVPDTTPGSAADATEEAPATQGVTSNWRLNAYNPATDNTLSFLIVFENVQGGLAGNAYAFDSSTVASTTEPSDPLGTVTGRVSSSEQLDFRITFADSLGGGTWDVSARLNNSAFAGRYTASDGGGGSVTGSNLDGN